jgi:hypothetical protein
MMNPARTRKFRQSHAALGVGTSTYHYKYLSFGILGSLASGQFSQSTWFNSTQSGQRASACTIGPIHENRCRLDQLTTGAHITTSRDMICDRSASVHEAI